MTAWKRMALSLGCVLIPFVFLGLPILIYVVLHGGFRAAISFLGLMEIYLIMAMPGWILALPFVLLFRHADGWRAWAMLAIGIAIGPVFMEGWMTLQAGHIRWDPTDGGAIVMSLLIGTPAVLAYVLLLRYLGRKRGYA